MTPIKAAADPSRNEMLALADEISGCAPAEPSDADLLMRVERVLRSLAAAPAGNDGVVLKYIKRWRTIVQLPAKYADEIVVALSHPQPREALAAEIKRAAAAPPITNPLVLPAGIKAGDYASPSPIPEAPVGWALVPLEPTQEMIAAAEDARFAYAGYCYRDAYREMVNAARALKPQDGGNCEHGITKVNCGICVPSEVFSKPQDGGESGR